MVDLRLFCEERFEEIQVSDRDVVFVAVWYRVAMAGLALDLEFRALAEESLESYCPG